MYIQNDFTLDLVSISYYQSCRRSSCVHFTAIRFCKGTYVNSLCINKILSFILFYNLGRNKIPLTKMDYFKIVYSRLGFRRFP